jgi:hypothetical protein
MFLIELPSLSKEFVMLHSRFVRMATYTGVTAAAAATVLGWGLVASRTAGAPTTRATSVAASVALAIPYALHFAFLILQGLPDGRRPVPVRVTRSPDGWILALVLGLTLPHGELAALSHAPWAAAERGVPLSLLTATVLIAARLVQLHFARLFGAESRR